MPKWTTSLGLLTRMISGLLGMALASCVLQKSSVCYSHCGTFAFDHVLAFFRRPPMTSWNVGVKIAIEEPPFKHSSLWRYFRPGSWSHSPMQLWAFLAPRQSLPGSRPAVSRHQSPWSMDVHGCPWTIEAKNGRNQPVFSMSSKHSKYIHRFHRVILLWYVSSPSWRAHDRPSSPSQQPQTWTWHPMASTRAWSRGPNRHQGSISCISVSGSQLQAM